MQNLRSQSDELEAAKRNWPPSDCDIQTLYTDFINKIHGLANNIVCGSCACIYHDPSTYRIVPVTYPLVNLQVDPNLVPFDFSCGNSVLDTEHIMVDKLALVSINGQDHIHLCRTCHAELDDDEIPIEALANFRWISPLPPELSDLTWMEQIVIARGYMVGRVVQLQNRYSSFSGLQGHVILIPQDTTRLLDLLPMSPSTLKDIIRVVWSGSDHPQPHELKRIFTIRKQKVYDALRWLIQHHSDYQNVRINHEELSMWESEFQPTSLINSVTHISDTIQDENSRSGFATEDFDIIDGDLPLTTTAMLDVNNVTEASVSVTLDQISDLVQRTTINIVNGSKIKDHRHDPAYFTSSYPVLFPYGTGGHQVTQRIHDISFPKWISLMLCHSSR
jgi:hypothetical protein